MGVSACGRVGVWACGRVGVWACGRVGVWALVPNGTVWDSWDTLNLIGSPASGSRNRYAVTPLRPHGLRAPLAPPLDSCTEGNKEWQTLEETRNFSAPQSVLEIAIGLYEDGRA